MFWLVPSTLIPWLVLSTVATVDGVDPSVVGSTLVGT